MKHVVAILYLKKKTKNSYPTDRPINQTNPNKQAIKETNKPNQNKHRMRINPVSKATLQDTSRINHV